MSNTIFEVFHLAANCAGMQSVANIFHLSHLLIECNQIPGDVVEFGCNAGHTAALMTVLTTKKIWVYDSFRGLPKPGDKEGVADCFKEGTVASGENVLDHTFRPCQPAPP